MQLLLFQREKRFVSLRSNLLWIWVQWTFWKGYNFIAKLSSCLLQQLLLSSTPRRQEVGFDKMNPYYIFQFKLISDQYYTIKNKKRSSLFFLWAYNESRFFFWNIYKPVANDLKAFQMDWILIKNAVTRYIISILWWL